MSEKSSADLPGGSVCTDASRTESVYFDGLIRQQGEFNPFTTRGWQKLARQFARVERNIPLGLLDIGCGTGQSQQIYISHCGFYVGLDLSFEALRTATRSFPLSSWIQADAGRFPFADESFDVVAFSSVLHHIPDFSSVLVEALRVLKSGGKIFAFDPNLRHPAMALFRHPRSPLYLSQGVSPNERPLRPGRLLQAFRAAGFTHIHQHCQSDISYRAVAPSGFNLFLSLFNFSDWVWERIGLGRYFGTFIITIGEKSV